MDEGRVPPRPPPKVMFKPRPGYSTLRPIKSRSQPDEMLFAPQTMDDSSFIRPTHKPPLPSSLSPPTSPTLTSPTSQPLAALPSFSPNNSAGAPVPPPKRPLRDGASTLRTRKGAPPLDLNAIISNADTNFASRSAPQSPTYGVPKKTLPPVPSQKSERPESPSNSPRKAPAVPATLRPTVTRTNSANFVMRRTRDNGENLTEAPSTPPPRPQRIKPFEPEQTIESPHPTNSPFEQTDDENPGSQESEPNPLSFSAPIRTRTTSKEKQAEPSNSATSESPSPSRPVFVIPQTLFALPPINPYVNKSTQQTSPTSEGVTADPTHPDVPPAEGTAPPVPSKPKPPTRHQKRASAPSSSGQIKHDPRKLKASGSGEKTIRTYSLASTSSAASFDGEFLGIPVERPSRAPNGLGLDKIDLEALGATCGKIEFKPTEWISPYGSYDNFVRAIREENLKSGLFGTSFFSLPSAVVINFNFPSSSFRWPRYAAQEYGR